MDLIGRLLVALILLLSVSHSWAFKKDQVYKMTLLHTNDHHGRFWKNRHGEYGLAARKSLIDSIRNEVKAQGGTVLLLSGGDINTGVPESDMLNAEPDFKGMKLIGYDAMAIGNHEFDNSLSVIRQQQEWAQFPFLAANIFYQNSKERPFLPYIIKTVHEDLKIAIVGFTTEDTTNVANPRNTKNIDIRSPVEVGKNLIPNLKQASDMIIAVTHMGHYPNGNHGSEALGDVTLARQVKGINIIVGGHTQKPLFSPDVQNGTYILQAHEWGKYVGRMDFEFKNGEIKLLSYKLGAVELSRPRIIISTIYRHRPMTAFLQSFS